MKLKLFAIASVLVLASGCAANGQVAELESRMNAVEQTSNEALTLARQAQSQAAQSENAARSAQNTADRALQAAQEANERTRRMAEVGSPRK
jgi:Tfp pilus assembly protein PilP